MKKAVKVLQTRRATITKAVAENPGITTAELAALIGVDSSKLVSNAVWVLLKSGKLFAEQIVRDGHHMNAYYIPDQVGADSVSRIRQKLVDAADVIPTPRSRSIANSVFDVPRAAKRRSKVRVHSSLPNQVSTHPAVNSTQTLKPATPTFACAVTNDGSLVLMREGHIEFFLSDIEAQALQRYLMKRAAANVFAEMI